MDGLIISLDTVEARISEPKDMSLGISKTETQRGKSDGGKGPKRGVGWGGGVGETDYPRAVGNYKSCDKGITGIPEKKEEKKKKKYLNQI